jgi:diguanylate cyclase (GGDEF)-like protein/PAS domain S-box-containing protein
MPASRDKSLKKHDCAAVRESVPWPEASYVRDKELPGPHPAITDEERLASGRAMGDAVLLGACGLLAVCAGVIGLWFFATASIRENYRHHLVTLAHVAALQVDAELHERLRHGGELNGPDYTRAVEPLRRLKTASPDIRFVYTTVLDGDAVRFVLDAEDPAEVDEDGLKVQSNIGDVDPTDEPVLLAALRGLVQGDEASTVEPYSSKWGSFMTGYAPIQDAAGRRIAVIGVDVNADVYIARTRQARRLALFGLVPAALLVLALSLVYYRQRMRALGYARSLAREQARLRESEASFRSLFELSPVGIALNDLATGQFLQANDALLQSSGLSREELLARTYWDVTPADYSDEERAQLESMERTNRYGPYEKEYIRKDGSRYPVLLSGIKLTDAHGREVIWSIVQDISQRKAFERELADAARRDKLTGLANRTQFMERLSHQVARAREGAPHPFAVLFLDFDHFKMVNDTLGHDAGDELLRQIAQRLRTTLRGGDDPATEARGTLVARFGGDEFLVLLTELRTGADAERIAERLMNALAPSYTIMGRDVHSSASIGIVTSEQCLDSADAIVRNADVAMYEAKRAGRSCTVVFNEAMHVRLTRHMTIESGLRRAFGTDQLSLVYQPIIELETGRTVSVEALLRWMHPVLGPVPPAEFIPVAEQSGLIVPLGQWVLSQSCHMLADWRIRDPDGAPDSVSVNISRAELALGPRLLARVRETLALTNLPAHCLQLEVTEREVMRDAEASLRLINDLRTLGVRLAMDDFGTGTSSLSCLRDYPFDVIKIDRSFVRDLASNQDVLAVIHATLTLVENLSMGSVAEGVEDATQVAVLQSLGCKFAQGYYFSRPVSSELLIAARLPEKVPA